MNDFIDLTEVDQRLITTGIPWFDEVIERALRNRRQATNMLAAMPGGMLFQFGYGLGYQIQSVDPGFSYDMIKALQEDTSGDQNHHLASMMVSVLLRLNQLEQQTVNKIMRGFRSELTSLSC